MHELQACFTSYLEPLGVLSQHVLNTVEPGLSKYIMHEIHTSLLWIGNAFDVRDNRVLFDAEIATVIDLAAEEQPASPPRQLIYCRYPLNDGGGNDEVVLSQLLRTLVGLLESNKRTLVACSAGRSRSPTIAAFGLALHLSQKPEEIIERIAEVKPLEVSPLFWDEVAGVYSELRQDR